MQPIREFMKSEFNISLKIWHNFQEDQQDKSVANIVPVIESLDPFALNSVF